VTGRTFATQGADRPSPAYVQMRCGRPARLPTAPHAAEQPSAASGQSLRTVGLASVTVPMCGPILLGDPIRLHLLMRVSLVLAQSDDLYNRRCHIRLIL
jgi:hypothetical protein